MILNFGKFKGWSTEDLAKAGNCGRNYLSWCADNLKNYGIRQTCAKVLSENHGIDFHLAVKALVQTEGMSEFDAQKTVNNELENLKDEDTYFDSVAQAEAQLEQDLLAAGLNEQQIKTVWRYRFDISQAPIQWTGKFDKPAILTAFEKFNK